jgi:hypothetical protein
VFTPTRFEFTAASTEGFAEFTAASTEGVAEFTAASP